MSSKSCLLLIFAAALLAALSENVDAKSQCPVEAQSILPCKCKVEFSFPIVICDGVWTTELSKIPEPFILRLQNINQSTFDSISFSTIRLSEFKLLNSKVSKVGKHVFFGQENTLLQISFDNTLLDRIPGSALSNLTSLDSISIRNSKLTKIVKADVDELPTSITTLLFERNELSSIEDESFSKLSNLRDLYLWYNSLSSLPNGCFTGTAVKDVWLPRNKFTQVPTASLKNLTHARIYLQYNEITSLPKENVMKPFIDKGNYINLINNPLQCTCDEQWISNLKYLIGNHMEGFCYGDKYRRGLALASLRPKYFSDCKK